MTPTETTALEIVSAVVIGAACIRLGIELVRAVRDRDQRNDDDREVGISDIAGGPVAAYDTDGGVMLETRAPVPAPGDGLNVYGAGRALIKAFGLPWYRRLSVRDEGVTIGLPDDRAVDAWSAALGWSGAQSGQWGDRQLALYVACGELGCPCPRASQMSGWCEQHHQELWHGAAAGQPYPVQPLDEYPLWRRDLDRKRS